VDGRVPPEGLAGEVRVPAGQRGGGEPVRPGVAEDEERRGVVLGGGSLSGVGRRRPATRHVGARRFARAPREDQRTRGADRGEEAGVTTKHVSRVWDGSSKRGHSRGGRAEARSGGGARDSRIEGL